MTEKTNYVYIVVRTDIPLEHQMVQACHASLEAGFSFERPNQIAHLVFCSVQSQKDLTNVAWDLEVAEVKFELFKESSWEMGYSALATEPVQNIVKSLKKLNLWVPPP